LGLKRQRGLVKQHGGIKLFFLSPRRTSGERTEEKGK
jgi:hypothetical protein